MTHYSLRSEVEKLRDMKVEFAPMEKRRDKIVKLEAEIKAHIKETGNTVDVDGVTIKITKPQKARVTYDVNKLEGFAAVHPELLELRTEKWAAPSISIKVAT